jgi:localization factor PodJL
MRSSTRHKQPAARKKGRSATPAATCEAPKLRDALEEIAGQLGEADKRHGSALAEMQERLSQLGHKVDGVRAGFSKPDVAALQRIEDGIHTLSEQFAQLGGQRQLQTDPAGTGQRAARPSLRPFSDSDIAASWDAESAEALTRVYERAGAELHKPAPGPRASKRGETSAIYAEPRPQSWRGDEPDRTWLEARLAGIDGLLQQALEGIDADKTLDAVKGRLDQFEVRFDAALETVAQRSDLEGLTLLESQLKDLTRQFEETSNQLARLDTIDEGLRDLALGLETQRQLLATGFDSKAIEGMIDAAADRAAVRLAGAAPATAPEGTEVQKRVEALEELLQDYIEERRRGEEVTGSILHTIEDALGRIVDRVDAIDVAKPQAAARVDQDRDQADGLDIESERLAQAYAAGARVLGQGRAERASSVLDAADYAPFATQEGISPDEASAEGTGEADVEPEAESAHASIEEQSSLEEQSKSITHSAAVPVSRPEAGTGAAVRSGLSTRGSRTRLSSVLAVLILLLFGTGGYLVVDVLLTSVPASIGGELPATSSAEAQPADDLAEAHRGASDGASNNGSQSSSGTKKSGLAAPIDGQSSGILLPPPPKPRLLPETTSGNGPTQVEADTRRRNAASHEAPGQGNAATLAATTIARTIEDDVETMRHGRPLLGESNPRLLPASFGPTALRNAAASGDPDAAFEVGTRFATGRGVVQDLKQAFAWYQRAAAQGHAGAQFRVAAFYERGIAVAADRERAALWYRRAAEQGLVKAMHNLAVLLAGKGDGPGDYAAAARWFREAAERGLADSQYNLAVLCQDGQGVARSLTEAYKWFALAARSGDPGAAQRLALVKAHLTPAELTAAEAMVAAWRVREAGTAVNIGSK